MAEPSGPSRHELDSPPKKLPAPKISKVLLIDDHRFDRESVARGLEENGHLVYQAEDAEAALDILRAEEVDIALVDRGLPGIDGDEFVRIIRKNQSSIELPVIMVTGAEETGAILSSFEAGANDYVTKPVKIDALTARVSAQVTIRRLREKLAREEEFVESIIQHAHDMIIVVDVKGTITLINRAACEHFGYSESAAIGKPAVKLFFDPALAFRHISDTLEGEDFLGEVECLHSAGRTFPVFLSTSMQRGSEGEPVGVICVLADLSERRRLMEERESLVVLKENFLALASHDLKGPLSNISGITGLLTSQHKPGDVLTEESFNFLKRIQRHVRRMNGLIEAFLDYRALEEGRLSLIVEPMCLGICAREIVRDNSERAAQKDIRLRFQKAEALPWIRGDKPRIEQIVDNLVGNAIKYCPRGSTVEIQVQSDGDWVELIVSDDGPGIPIEKLESIFERFTVVPGRRSTGGDSTSSGLGLSICKQLVELHEGNIKAANNAGGGAEFVVRFPAHQSSSPPEASRH